MKLPRRKSCSGSSLPHCHPVGASQGRSTFRRGHYAHHRRHAASGSTGHHPTRAPEWVKWLSERSVRVHSFIENRPAAGSNIARTEAGRAFAA